MITLLSVVLFLAVILLSIGMVLFLVFAIDSLARGHDVSTSRRATRALVKAVRQYKPDAKNFYDVGCAHGGLALAVKKALPHIEVYGIDKSAVRFFLPN